MSQRGGADRYDNPWWETLLPCLWVRGSVRARSDPRTDTGEIGFLHHTFQEFFAALHIATLPVEEAQHAIAAVLTTLAELSACQVLLELARLLHDERAPLEDHLYERLLMLLTVLKKAPLTPPTTDALPPVSVFNGAIDTVLTRCVIPGGHATAPHSMRELPSAEMTVRLPAVLPLCLSVRQPHRKDRL